MHKKQLATLALIVLFPFILVLALILINPTYMEQLFKSIGALNGFSLVVLLVLLHGLVFFVAVQTTKERKFPSKALILLTILTCSLPSVLTIFLYPSMRILLQQGSSF